MNVDDLVAEYGNLTDNQLFEALAMELLGEDWLGIGGHRLNRLRTYGKEKWIDSQRLLAERVCDGEGKSRFVDSQVAIGQGLVAAISEILHFSEKESAMVAVLLLRYGLDNFCSEVRQRPKS